MELLQNQKIDPHKYSQLIFDKGAKAIQWRKNILKKKKKGARTNEHPMQKKLIKTLSLCISPN